MAKVIMIQGTMSNVGKSFFAAGLCRVFKQDGYRVAPFKSQNMALNSYITKDGYEMGRAQVMQAEAAGVEPDVCMNPILLKPTTDVGSQVIVNGKVLGNMRAAEYFQYKKQLIPEIMKAYEKLDAENDIIVIEGAGSPVELNLKQDDIVNMGLARLVHAPVLLVGDIDRGGVFAQLIGTYDLLEADERELVKGLIVNKFRGDRTLFSEGVTILEEKSGVPVLGVVPYMDVDIDDEDSLSDKLAEEVRGTADKSEQVIDIVVIKLHRISNFTDFDAFNQYTGVTVRYVSRVEQLGRPDFIILPGTKSTITDLMWLRECGLEAAIKQCVAAGVPLFGICGGYQMLGMRISDPEEVESGGEIRGMELLPVATVFCGEKKRTRVTGTIGAVQGDFTELSGQTFSGYEIHMGESASVQSSQVKENISASAYNMEEEIAGDMTFAMLSSGQADGAYKNNVYGTYVHGIFDEQHVSETIIKSLYHKKGLEYQQCGMHRSAYKELQYEKMAEQVRANVDMKKIYEMLEL